MCNITQFNKKYLLLSLVFLSMSSISAMKQESAQEINRRFENERAKQQLKDANPTQRIVINPTVDFNLQLAATNHNIKAGHQTQNARGRK